ncbi:lysozyme C-2-like [Cetorhinus maximus]
MKILAVLSLLFLVTSGKVYEKCELVQVFKDKGLDGFDGHSLANWVCVVESESKFNSNLRTKITNYGIFQINSRRWCDDGISKFSHNLCQINCTSLLDDDITDDIECAKEVALSQLGIENWPGWRKSCLGRDHSHILDDCQL